MIHYGWMGTRLEVDLSRGTIEKVEEDRSIYETFIGGKGINAKIFWDRVPPETDPFSPKNLLIAGTGVLTGTMVPSANRGVFTFKSPQTGLHMHSSLGGFWPTELKHAGYDTVVIEGKSATPVYLWISDDHVELRDASHLKGKGTQETITTIREELKNNDVQVACIGPAGENRCYSASIESSVGASASRGGPGAVMGDKNLKAIAVRGTKDVKIANPARMLELCEQIRDRSGPFRQDMEHFSYGMAVLDTMGAGLYGNLNETYSDLSQDSLFKQDLDAVSVEFPNWLKNSDGAAACSNCGVNCRMAFVLPDGGCAYLKCHLWNSFMVSTKIIDYNFTLECCRLSQQNGLDIIAVARCIAFAIDLYEKGILTKEETGGMDLIWSDKEVVLSLIEKISRREDIGDLLAEGVYKAANRIGRGAEAHVHHIKKLEYAPPGVLMYMPYLALAQAISDKGDMSRNVSSTCVAWAGYSEEQRKELVNSPYWIYPRTYEKYYMADFSHDGTDYEPGCQFIAYDDETYSIIDMTGICSYWSVFLMNSPINSRALMADLVSCVTGMEINEADLTIIGRRTLNLVRSANIRLGMRRKDDSLSKIIHKNPPSPALNRLDPEIFNKWIDRYYEIKGWNSQGIPTRQTLQELGLDYVWQDLQ